ESEPEDERAHGAAVLLERACHRLERRKELERQARAAVDDAGAGTRALEQAPERDVVVDRGAQRGEPGDAFEGAAADEVERTDAGGGGRAGIGDVAEATADAELAQERAERADERWLGGGDPRQHGDVIEPLALGVRDDPLQR